MLRRTNPGTAALSLLLWSQAARGARGAGLTVSGGPGTGRTSRQFELLAAVHNHE